jgi:putative PIN family toxin of toxin-antitoxin system
MRIVLDTNVLVSGLLSPFGPPSTIVRMVSSGDLEICVDARVLCEYAEVLQRPKFQLETAKVAVLLEQIERTGLMVAPAPLPRPLPDPTDAPFLEVAIAAGAECLVTGNLDRFPRERRQRVRILSPREFLKYYSKRLRDR